MDAIVGGPVARSLERDPRSLPEPSSAAPFEPVDLDPPPLPARPGIVARTALVDRLLAARAASVLTVVAPPGYGKTTLLTQWAQHKAPRVGWVTVDRRDNDPAVFLTVIAVALDRVEPLDQGVFRTLASPGASVLASGVPQLGAAVSAMRQEVALVLDHVELLDNPRCMDAVAELAARLPRGSQLALASRTRPPLPVGLLRARGQVVEVGVHELAMDQLEARALLAGAGLHLGEAQAAELLRRTEGWPVGLYLAALALKAGGSQDHAGVALSGDDRYIADYLRSELLARLPGPTVSFLTRTSVLERMCGPLCDAVLEASGSGKVLETLAGSNLLLVPLDRHDRWYRYHHLFRDLLRAELGRREPDLVRELHLRAAAWHRANGLPELAVDHAQAAGDADQVAGLVAGLSMPAYAGGRVDTVDGWMAWFEERGLINRYPSVAALGAWIQALLGRAAAAERWAGAVEHATVEWRPPDGSAQAYLALLDAMLCRSGVARMRADAELARDQLAPGAQFRAAALVMEGVSYLLDGDPDRADPILAHAAEVGIHAGAMPAASIALAERALAAVERDDWDEAEALIRQARTIIQERHLEDYISAILVSAMTARVALRRGDLPQAEEHLARAGRLRPLLSHAIPHLAVQTLLELARAYLALDDVAGASAVLRQARDVLLQRPDLGVLGKRAEELRSKVRTVRGATAGASSLTTAELRLLPLLATHLSFKEIGQRLFVSPNTVKTQAMSIYRKFGASSRSEAIKRAQQLGLRS